MATIELKLGIGLGPRVSTIQHISLSQLFLNMGIGLDQSSSSNMHVYQKSDMGSLVLGLGIGFAIDCPVC